MCRPRYLEETAVPERAWDGVDCIWRSSFVCIDTRYCDWLCVLFVYVFCGSIERTPRKLWGRWFHLYAGFRKRKASREFSRSHVSSDRLTDRRTEDMVRNGYESDRSDVLNLNSSDIRTNIKDTTGSYCTWYYCMNVESSVVLTLNSLFERTKYAAPRMRRQRTEEAPLILTSLDSNQARNVLNQTEQWCAASRHGPGHSCAVLVQLKHLGF